MASSPTLCFSWTAGYFHAFEVKFGDAAVIHCQSLVPGSLLRWCLLSADNAGKDLGNARTCTQASDREHFLLILVIVRLELIMILMIFPSHTSQPSRYAWTTSIAKHGYRCAPNYLICHFIENLALSLICSCLSWASADSASMHAYMRFLCKQL